MLKTSASVDKLFFCSPVKLFTFTEINLTLAIEHYSESFHHFILAAKEDSVNIGVCSCMQIIYAFPG